MFLVDFVKANQDILTSITSLSAVGGLVTAISSMFIWIANEKRRRRVEAQEVYSQINDQYFSYLAIALQYPQLDAADYSLGSGNRVLTTEENLQQQVLFSMITSILERTYMLMNSVLGKENPEWSGWDSWVEMWFEKESYRRYWEDPNQPGCFQFTGQWLPGFERYMEQKYNLKSKAVQSDPAFSFLIEPRLS